MQSHRWAQKMQTRCSSPGETDSRYPGYWAWGFEGKNTSGSRALRWKREVLETACSLGARRPTSRGFWVLQCGFLLLYHFASLDLCELPKQDGEFRHVSWVQDVGMLCTLTTASYQDKAGCTRTLLSHTHMYLSSALAATGKKPGKRADWKQKQTSP